MDQTIVAVFDTYQEAVEARQDLIDSGFSTSDLELSDAGQRTTVSEQPAQEGGFWHRLRELFTGEERDYYEEASRRGHALLTVHCDSEDQLDNAVDILQRHHPIDLDQRAQEWRKSGWTGQTAATAGTVLPGEREEKIPVVEEKLNIGKRAEIRGGVRVYSRVTETPVSEDVTLREEKVDVERRRVDRPASPEELREQTIEMTEVREEPVVNKEARIVEEIILTKDVTERTETVKDKVRKTDVDVEQMDDIARRDFESRYAGRGYNYEQCQAAYRFGYDLSQDARYRGRSWSEVEPEARSLFEERNPGRWTEFKEAVRSTFEGRRQRRAA